MNNKDISDITLAALSAAADNMASVKIGDASMAALSAAADNMASVKIGDASMAALSAAADNMASVKIGDASMAALSEYITSNFQRISEASISLRDVFNQTEYVEAIGPLSVIRENAIKQTLTGITVNQLAPSAVVSSSLGPPSLSIIGEGLIGIASRAMDSGIDLKAIQRTAALIHKPIINSLNMSLGSVAESFDRLSAAQADFPDFVLPGATRELFTTGMFLETVCMPCREEKSNCVVPESEFTTAAEKDSSACEDILNSYMPALVPMYLGARRAIDGRNPDRVRHVLTSLREMWKHLLWNLAPNQEVIEWANVLDNRDDLLNNKGPTRRARILYLCRNFNSSSLSDFIIEDSKTLATMIDFCNNLHEVEIGITDEQLRILLLRSDSYLKYILMIKYGS